VRGSLWRRSADSSLRPACPSMFLSFFLLPCKEMISGSAYRSGLLPCARGLSEPGLGGPALRSFSSSIFLFLFGPKKDLVRYMFLAFRSRESLGVFLQAFLPLSSRTLLFPPPPFPLIPPRGSYAWTTDFFLVSSRIPAPRMLNRRENFSPPST